MVVKSIRPRFLCVLLCASLIALCISLALPASTQAHITLPHTGPTMQVSAGFSSRYRDGDWVPLHITLHNSGPDFTGTISVNFQKVSISSVSEPASRYQQTISLPNGAQKQVTMYVPVSLGTQGSTQALTVDLLDSNGNRVTSQVTTLRSLGTNDLLVGVLSDQSTGISALGQVSQPNQTASVYEEPLDATSMPDNAAALQNFDLIVMDYFTTSSLSNSQLTALDNWVSQGGSLVIAGGPEWRRTLTGLPHDLVPVNVTGTSTLPVGTDLLPIGSPGRDGPGAQNVSDTAPAPIVVSDAAPDTNSTVLQAAGRVPLIVETQHNQGNVYYLAFDPSLTPLANWSNAANLWQGLLIRTVGDRFLDASQNPSAYASVYSNSHMLGPSGGDWQTVLQTLFPNAFPATWLILTLLIGYVVILGPVRLVMIRIAKKRTWSWRIVLATIALFTALSYGLAIQQKGTSIVGSSISIMQLGAINNNASSAHVTTYVGVFVPSQGNYVVHLTGNNLVQPLGSNNMYQGPNAINSASQSVITTTSNGTDASLQGVNIWTLQSLASSYDTQVKGGIISRLQMNGNILQGTVTNSLPYALDDAYILIGQQPISVGHLDAGETKQIDTTLLYKSAASSNSPSLADQIASSHGLSIPYIPETTGDTTLQNDYERHAAVLATLSGENSLYCGNGNPCYQSALASSTSGQVIINGRAILTSTGQDPLLLPNAPATFIGWISDSANNVNSIVVNGSSVHGTQESLVQAPLDVSLAGGVNLPSSFVNGQLTDVQTQGSNIQIQFPGVYTLSTGSLTFEFASPALRNMNTSTLTFTENTNLVSSLGNIGSSSSSNLNTPGDFSHVQIYLYNWQTHKWDQVSFNQDTLTVHNAQAYVGTDGRILMQFSNQDSSQGTTLLTRPTLQLQGQLSR